MYDFNDMSPTGVMYVSGEDNGDDEEDDFYMFGDNMDFLEQQVNYYKP